MQMQMQTKLRALASELAAEARTRAAWFDLLRIASERPQQWRR